MVGSKLALNENPIEMHSLALNWNEVLTTLQ